jgi:hypothetical protein
MTLQITKKHFIFTKNALKISKKIRIYLSYNSEHLHYLSAFYTYVWIFLSARNLWVGYCVICGNIFILNGTIYTALIQALCVGDWKHTNKFTQTLQLQNEHSPLNNF